VNGSSLAALRRRGPLLCAALVLAVALRARLSGLGDRSLWFDEGVSLGVVRLPWGTYLAHAWDRNLGNQLLYYLVLRGWRVFGESEWALRSLGALLSTAAVLVTFSLARRLFGLAAAATAGLVLALHPLEIWQAQQARGYGLAVFLCALSALLLARWVEVRSRAGLAAWAAVCALALYAHFFSGLVVAAEALSLAALGRPEPRDRLPLALALAAIAAAALPILAVGVLTPKDFVAFVPPLSSARLLDAAVALGGGSARLALLAGAAIAALTVRLVRLPRGPARWAVALALSWAVVPILALAAISLVQPILLARYLTMAAPGWALAAGGAAGILAAGRPGWAGPRAGAGLALAGAGLLAAGEARLVLRNRGFQVEDWRGAAAHVAAATLPGDAIVYDSSWAGLTFEYYLDRAARRPEALQRGSRLVDGRFDLDEDLRRERVWLVLSRESPAARALGSELRRTHPVERGTNLGGLGVILFDVRRREAPGP